MALKNHGGAEPRGLVESKHIAQGIEGRRARRLEDVGRRVNDVLDTRLRLASKVSKDNILDALVCLWSTRRIARGEYQLLPDPAIGGSESKIYC